MTNKFIKDHIYRLRKDLEDGEEYNGVTYDSNMEYLQYENIIPISGGTDTIEFDGWLVSIDMCYDTGIVFNDEKILIRDDNIRPKHYKLKGLYRADGTQTEVLDVIKGVLTDEEYRGFLKGNEIKYILREKHKNGIEDLKKNGQYNQWLIKHDEEDVNKTKK